MNHEQQPSADAERRAAQLNEAFRLYAHYEGWAATQAHFAKRYRGTWASLTDYGQALLTQLGAAAELADMLPDWLMPFLHVDYEGFAREDLKRDHVVIEGPSGLHVFARYDQEPDDVKSTSTAA